jgi:hypothetical protein
MTATIAAPASLERRMCVDKRKYTKNAAHYQACVQRKHTGENIQPYKCWFCARWHIGHAR